MELETGSTISCEKVDRDYRIGLRVGLLFVMLATGSIAVFGPILARKLANLSLDGIAFTIIKQFGTGVIISTAFVHVSDGRSLVRLLLTSPIFCIV